MIIMVNVYPEDPKYTKDYEMYKSRFLKYLETYDKYFLVDEAAHIAAMGHKNQRENAVIIRELISAEQKALREGSDCCASCGHLMSVHNNNHSCRGCKHPNDCWYALANHANALRY
jgi:hypothetical protein